ncbi:LRRN4 C-terminal-like protein [Bagarius yarrelli]|uniref:LRRN4 C-terminal-like protein n=1 Tax=Bagarius yarrelli TaxID=175774 RepID=A0A556UXY5_BAGYA|nr:LRRN4 C-terminal-like protein [Bagarius yarrelli]
MWRKRPTLFCLRLLSIALLISYMPALSVALARSATRPPNAPDPQFFNQAEYYDNIYDDTFTNKPTNKPAGSPSPLCDYDICKDQQESCQKLALALSCSCPGISSPFQLPDPPSLQSLSLESKKAGVVVRWCAPPSTVTHYLVMVEGQDMVLQASEDRRMMELGDLAPGTEVCIEAVNKVGVSTLGKDSCARFEPNSSELKLAVKLALIGTAVVLVVIILVGALLLWCCRRHRKTQTRTVNSGHDVVL